MEKSDIRELKKAVKSRDGGIIHWIYAFYVDSDNQPVWEQVMRLQDMEDSTRFRHLDIIQKVLSTRLGRDAFSVKMEQQNEELLSLRSAEGRDPEEFHDFREAMLEGYLHTDPYYAILARIVYDVPHKGTDGRTMEDGELVYEAVLLAVCPAKLTKAALGIKEEEVAELDRRWQIGNPASGFVYPAFSGRMEDRNEVLLRTKSPAEDEYYKELFHVEDNEAPVGIKTQQEIFNDLLSRMEMKLEDAALLSSNILEKAAEEDAPPVIDREVIRKMAEAAEVPTENFDEIYDDAVGETQITFDAVAEPYVTVKTDTAVLKVPSERAQLIETRLIDGREYILIPADGVITLNGASVRTE